MKKEDRLLRVGVLGCGPIAQAAHLDACIKARNVELYAICDQATDLVARMKSRFKPKKTFVDYDAMLGDPDVEAVVIAVSDPMHIAAALKALDAGKHVLIEKPLGTTVSDCDRLADRAEASDRVVQVGTMKKFHPGIEAARDFFRQEGGAILALKAWYCDSIYRYIETDNLQPVIETSQSARRPLDDPKANRSVYYLLGHGSHLFDTALYLGGPIKAVRATKVERFGSHCWMVTAEFENGSIGQLNLTIPVKMTWHEGFEVYAEGGSVIGRTLNPWYFRSSEVDCFSAKTASATRVLGADAHFYKRQIEGFADVVLKGIEQRGATARDGAHVLRALTAVSLACRSDQRILLADVSGEEIQ